MGRSTYHATLLISVVLSVVVMVSRGPVAATGHSAMIAAVGQRAASEEVQEVDVYTVTKG